MELKKKTTKILFSVLFMIVLISNINAELIINSPINIVSKINQDSYFNITLTNTFNFRITNFEFRNLPEGFIFPEIILEPNETKTIQFKVNINKITSESINSEVIFKYNVNVPSTQQTYNINITSNGFSPDFLIIHQGDIVIWKNIDDITHSVTGSNFDSELTTNQTFSYTFNAIGTEDYQDLILFYPATVKVLDRNSPQLVNNPNYNKNIIVNLDIISDPTTLSINIPENSFVLDPQLSTEGLITIENTGDTQAQKINLESSTDWIIFNENNFNIDSKGKKYIPFTIQPLVFSTNETNKTYTFNIKIKALNTNEYNQSINVFLKYSDVFSSFESNEGFLNWFKNVFCPQNPKLFICNTSASSNQGQVIIRDPDIPINLTASQVYAMLKRIQRIEDSNQRTNNKINSLTETLETTLPENNNLLNESITNSKKTEENRKTNERIIWIMAIFIILITGFIYIWRYIEKYRYKRYMMGVGKT